MGDSKDGVPGLVEGLSEEGFLIGSEWGEHIVCLLPLRKIITDPNSKARILGRPKPLGNMSEAVVPTTAATRPEAEGPDGKMQVVDDDEKLVEAHVVFLTQRDDGVAAPVHVGQGESQPDIPIL